MKNKFILGAVLLFSSVACNAQHVMLKVANKIEFCPVTKFSKNMFALNCGNELIPVESHLQIREVMVIGDYFVFPTMKPKPIPTSSISKCIEDSSYCENVHYKSVYVTMRQDLE